VGVAGQQHAEATGVKDANLREKEVRKRQRARRKDSGGGEAVRVLVSLGAGDVHLWSR